MLLDTCYIDIGKLVMGNLKEYSKLLSFIEEEPLEDFKTITNDYREFAFGKYMKWLLIDDIPVTASHKGSVTGSSYYMVA